MSTYYQNGVISDEIALKKSFDQANANGQSQNAENAVLSTKKSELVNESSDAYQLRYQLYQIMIREFHKIYNLTIAAQICAAKNSKYKCSPTNHMGYLFGVEKQLGAKSPAVYMAIVGESEACFSLYDDYVKNWQKTWTFDSTVALRNRLIAHYRMISDNSVEGQHVGNLVSGFTSNSPKVLELKAKHDILKSATSAKPVAQATAAVSMTAAAPATTATSTLPGYANHLSAQAIAGLYATAAVYAENANPSNDMGNSAAVTTAKFIPTN